MHLLLLTDEKCQLSCLYLGVFALFICFISACCSYPWQLPAPCSEHKNTLAHKGACPRTQTHCLFFFFQTVSSLWARWLTHSLTSEAPVCVCCSECVWFIDIRETYNAHACLLSVWGLWAAGGRTHAPLQTYSITPAIVPGLSFRRPEVGRAVKI